MAGSNVYFLRRGDLHWVKTACPPGAEKEAAETTMDFAAATTMPAGEEPTDFEKHAGNVYARLHEAVEMLDECMLDSGNLDAHAVATLLERAKTSLRKAQEAHDEEVR